MAWGMFWDDGTKIIPWGSRQWQTWFLRLCLAEKDRNVLGGKNVTYGLNCYLCVAHSLFLGQHRKQRMHLFCGKGQGTGEETETRGLCNNGVVTSLQEVCFKSFGKVKHSSLKRSLLRDLALVLWHTALSLVIGILGTSIPSGQAGHNFWTLPEQTKAYPCNDHRSQIASGCSESRRPRTRARSDSLLNLSGGKWWPLCCIQTTLDLLCWKSFPREAPSSDGYQKAGIKYTISQIKPNNFGVQIYCTK